MITPHTGGQVREIYKKNLNDWKCPNNIGGHKRKFSIIKGAQTKLRGMKKNPKDLKKFWAKKKKWDAQPNEKKKQRERAQAQHWGAR
jgi:hypothetical protein